MPRVHMQRSDISNFSSVSYNETSLKFIGVFWQAEMSAPLRGHRAPECCTNSLPEDFMQHMDKKNIQKITQNPGKTHNLFVCFSFSCLASCCCANVLARKLSQRAYWLRWTCESTAKQQTLSWVLMTHLPLVVMFHALICPPPKKGL